MFSRYQLNHPKNYVAYALALAETNDPDRAAQLTEEYVTNGVGMARRGAENLGLVDDGELTHRGRWLANHPEWFNGQTIRDVLRTFDDRRGTRKRFVEDFPGFWETAPGIAYGDETIARLASILEAEHARRSETALQYGLETNTFLARCWERNPSWALELFIADNETVREHILDRTERYDADYPDELDQTDYQSLQTDALWQNRIVGPNATSIDYDGPIYRSTTTYQLKTVGWHLGVFHTKGVQSVDLDPETLTWGLETDAADSLIHAHGSVDIWGEV
jgi:hypothetical protein